jgi:hypothetical protein
VIAMQQAATPQAATPAPPSPPPAPIQVEVGPGQVIGVPTTRAEVNALRSRRSEISNQLENVADRRARLVESLQGTEGAVRTGIEQRIQQLDGRILQLEKELEVTGLQLTRANVDTRTGTMPPPPGPEGFSGPNVERVAGLFTLLVLVPLAFSFARLMWKRATRMSTPAPAPARDERLDRIEQAVDAIAIEVERIGEAQRFTTRLLTEGHAQPFPVGEAAMQSGRVPEYESARRPVE